MSKPLKVVVGTLAVGAAVAIFLYSRNASAKQDDMKTVEIVKGTIVDKALAVGQIVPDQEIQVKSQISGIVARCFVEVGDRVEQGQPLFSITPDPTPLELAEAERGVEMAQVAYDKAQQDLERTRTLFSGGILPRDQFPTAVLNAAHLVGQCAIPVGMILIGATVADHVAGFHSAGGARTMALGSLLRLAVLPVLFLLVARWLPCSVELKRVILIQAAMPAAVFPIVMVRHYGGDPATALQVVMSTSILSLVTIPLWLHFGVRLAGLQ